MKAHRASKPGKCGTCQQEYKPGAALLLSDDGKDLIGCELCPSLQIKVKLKKSIEGDRLSWQVHDKDRKFKCENCGNWNEPGAMKLTARIDGGPNWPVVIACPQCKDLTPIDRAALKLGPQGAAAEKAEKARAKTEAQNWTVEQANDAGRREAMVGNWAPAAALLSHDPTLPETAAKRNMDLPRLTSAFVTAAMLDPALAACTAASWVIAFRQALELGIYPTKGALALGYLFARGDTACLQVGYKAASDIVLSLPDVTGLNTGIYWPCEAQLGNLAAPYHEARRHARACIAKGHAPPAGAIDEAAKVVEARGKATLARCIERLHAAKVDPEKPTAQDRINHANLLALYAALKLDAFEAGRDWWEWEWFRWVAGDDLIVLDLPAPGIWARPTMNNAAGVVPAAAWALVRLRGRRDSVAEVIEAPRVMAIGVKGGNGTINKAGGMAGSVWGDDQSADWMWRKTALLQAAVHGRLRLRDVDPDRARVLEMLEPGDPEAQPTLPTQHADLASYAWARAGELRQQAPASGQVVPADRRLGVDDAPPVLDIPDEPSQQTERVLVPASSGAPSVAELQELVMSMNEARVDAAFESAGIPSGVPVGELTSEQRAQVAAALRA